MAEDDLEQRLQKREHHFRRAVEGEYDANLMLYARHRLESYREALERVHSNGDVAAVMIARQALQNEVKG